MTAFSRGERRPIVQRLLVSLLSLVIVTACSSPTTAPPAATAPAAATRPAAAKPSVSPSRPAVAEENDEAQTFSGPVAHPTAHPQGLNAGSDIPTAPHPTPQEEVYNGCPGQGDGTDPELNTLKNRVDSGQWQPVPFAALLHLGWPPGIDTKHMAQWSAADRAQVAPHNGVPVQTEGYILLARQEGPESPNCHSVSDLDFHTWLADQPGSPAARPGAVVIEFTPRVRAKHPTWTVGGLNSLAQARTRVRVSGWTMLDPEHPDQVGKTRGTIWEIHPVMLLEVAQGSGWKEF